MFLAVFTPQILTVSKSCLHHLQNITRTSAFSLPQSPPLPRYNLPSSGAQSILFYSCCPNYHKLRGLKQHKVTYEISKSVSLTYSQDVSGLFLLEMLGENLFAWFFLLPASLTGDPFFAPLQSLASHLLPPSESILLLPPFYKNTCNYW